MWICIRFSFIPAETANESKNGQHTPEWQEVYICLEGWRLAVACSCRSTTDGLMVRKQLKADKLAQC
jgi:hypothetical protein